VVESGVQERSGVGSGGFPLIAQRAFSQRNPVIVEPADERLGELLWGPDASPDATSAIPQSDPMCAVGAAPSPGRRVRLCSKMSAGQGYGACVQQTLPPLEDAPSRRRLQGWRR
jgi:hypothetical protein